MPLFQFQLMVCSNIFTIENTYIYIVPMFTVHFLHIKYVNYEQPQTQLRNCFDKLSACPKIPF